LRRDEFSRFEHGAADATRRLGRHLNTAAAGGREAYRVLAA
jgi:hypothetical protein